MRPAFADRMNAIVAIAAVCCAVAAVVSTAAALARAGPGQLTARLRRHVCRPEEPGHLRLAAGSLHGRADRTAARRGSAEPELPRDASVGQLHLRRQRDRQLRGDEDGLGQRVRRRPRDGAAEAPQPPVVRRRRAGAHQHGSEGPERARRELRRGQRRGPADRRQRLAQGRDERRPAHGIERQSAAAEGAARALDQARSVRGEGVFGGPRHRQGADLRVRRGHREQSRRTIRRRRR